MDKLLLKLKNKIFKDNSTSFHRYRREAARIKRLISRLRYLRSRTYFINYKHLFLNYADTDPKQFAQIQSNRNFRPLAPDCHYC